MKDTELNFEKAKKFFDCSSDRTTATRSECIEIMESYHQQRIKEDMPIVGIEKVSSVATKKYPRDVLQASAFVDGCQWFEALTKQKLLSNLNEE